MHIFTLIQIICVGILWGVKLSPGAMAFPFVLILLVPLRLFFLKYIFSTQELSEVCMNFYYNHHFHLHTSILILENRLKSIHSLQLLMKIAYK